MLKSVLDHYTVENKFKRNLKIHSILLQKNQEVFLICLQKIELTTFCYKSKNFLVICYHVVF